MAMIGEWRLKTGNCKLTAENRQSVGSLACWQVWLLLLAAIEVFGATLDDFGQGAEQRWSVVAAKGASATIRGGRIEYHLPPVLKGYRNRDASVALARAVNVTERHAVFGFEVEPLTGHDHRLQLRVTDSDGTVGVTRPVFMYWAGKPRKFEEPASHMRVMAEGKDDRLRPPFVKLELVVTQGMCMRFGEKHYYADGAFRAKRLWVRSDAELSAQRAAFDGRVFAERTKMGWDVAHDIPLRIVLNDGPALPTGMGYPIRTGIPFPEAAVLDVSDIQLLRGGREVAWQPKVLARWADGSLKAVLVQFLADLGTPDAYRLRFGRSVVRTRSPHSDLARVANGSVVADTGRVTAKFSKLVKGGPLVALSQGGAQLRMSFEDGLVGKVREIAVEANGPLFAVVRVEGACDLGAESGFAHRFVMRFVLARGSDLVQCALTVVNESGRRTDFALIPRLWLRTSGPFRCTSAVLGSVAERLDVPRQGLTAFQDGGHVRGARLAFPCTVTVDGGKVIRERDRPQGYIEHRGRGGAWRLGVREWWQNNPKSLWIAQEHTVLGLSAAKSCRGERFFYHGMAKTHDLTLQIDPTGKSPDGVRAFLREPLALARPEWYCKSGVFGALGPADPKRFAAFEAAAQTVARELFDWPREFNGLYGLRNFGDFRRDRGQWMNLETAMGLAAVRQFVRTGDKEAFAWARQACRHYADVDTCHAALPGVKWTMDRAAGTVEPESGSLAPLGGVYGHTLDHAGDRRDPTKRSKAGVGGHDWYTGISLLYLLTGDERLRDCIVLHARATADRLAEGLDDSMVLGRGGAWPLKNLCAAYEITGNADLLEAAAVAVNFWSYWRDASAAGYFGGTMYQDALPASAVLDYWRVTRDPMARDLFFHMLHRQIDGLAAKTPEGEGLPQEALYHQDHRSFMLMEVLGDAYALTGDARYIRPFVDTFYFFTDTQPDVTMLWSAPAFLRGMAREGIAEPRAHRAVPLPLFGGTKRAVVLEPTDRDFTVSVTRQLSFRGARLYNYAGGLWSLEEQRAKQREYLTALDYGRITITSPSGKPAAQHTIRQCWSRVHSIPVKSDGEAGVYRIEVVATDPFVTKYPYGAFFINSDLAGLMVEGRDAVFAGSEWFLMSQDDRPFKVSLHDRKSRSGGGGWLIGPAGERRAEAYWDAAHAGDWHSLAGRGRGVWRLVRSTRHVIEPVRLEGVQGYWSNAPERLFVVDR